MLSHLLRVHSNDPELFITCNVSGCQCTFTNANIYKSHLNRTHKNLDLQAAVPSDEENDNEEKSGPEEMESNSDDRNGHNSDNDDDD